MAVLDKNFFDQCLAIFANYHDAYCVTGVAQDENFVRREQYEYFKVWGSLQPEGTSYETMGKGKAIQSEYKFYCRADTRLKLNDFIKYNDKLLKVYRIEDYDTFGFNRVVHLTMVQLTEYNDLQEFIKIREGQLKNLGNY